MKKILFIIIAIVVCSMAYSQKTYFDLTHRTANNVDVTDHSDGSLTLTLIDGTVDGSVVFTNITDITAYGTFGYSYILNVAGGATFSVGGKDNTPYSSIGVDKVYTMTVAIDELTVAEEANFTVTLKKDKEAAVTLSKVYVSNPVILPDNSESIASMAYNSYDNAGEPTTATNTLAASFTLPASSNPILLGASNNVQRLPGKYYDLSAYSKIQIQLTAPESAAGDEFTMRYLFLKDEIDESKTPQEYILDDIRKTITLTGGTQVLELDLAEVAYLSRKLAFIQVRDGSESTATVDVDYIVATTTSVGLDHIQVMDADLSVDVYDLSGCVLRKQVKLSEATNGLGKGIYIIGGKKVSVR